MEGKIEEGCQRKLAGAEKKGCKVEGIELGQLCAPGPGDDAENGLVRNQVRMCQK